MRNIWLALLCVALSVAGMAAQAPSAPKRTHLQDLQLREIGIVYELFAARIHGDPGAEALAEQALADCRREIAAIDTVGAAPGSDVAPRPSTARYARHGDAVLPDPRATPGVFDPKLTKAVLCDPKFHTGTDRHVTLAQKKRVCLAYGIANGCPGPGYEIDHLGSIELGGSNDDANLWPQPVDASGVIGFHAKDVVENRAHRAACEGRITLEEAQRGITSDWYAFGLKYGFIAPAK